MSRGNFEKRERCLSDVYETTGRFERYRVSRRVEPRHGSGPTPTLKTLFNDAGTASTRRISAHG
jgi:hypothetical protein